MVITDIIWIYFIMTTNHFYMSQYGKRIFWNVHVETIYL